MRCCDLGTVRGSCRLPGPAPPRALHLLLVGVTHFLMSSSSYMFFWVVWGIVAGLAATGHAAGKTVQKVPIGTLIG